MEDRDTWGLATYFIILMILGYFALKFLEVSSDIVVAIVGVMGSLVLAVFKYSSDRLKEKEKEIERSKKENYQKLLQAIGKYATGVSDKKELEVIYTESWAYADAYVVKNIGSFLEEPSQKSLSNLLLSMRESLGMKTSSSLGDYAEFLYPQRVDGLKSGYH